MDNLKAVCRGLTQRSNNSRFETFECFICGNRTIGPESLHLHFLEFHQIVLESFHDCTDFNGLLAHVRALTVLDTNQFQCPICQVVVPTASGLTAHITEASHDQWIAREIPTLASFLISVVGESGQPQLEDGNSSADEDDNDHEHNNAAGNSDLDDDEEAEPQIPCLYCSLEIDEASFDQHLESAHGLSLQNYVSQHATVITNEYDLIRMVNAVRDAQKSLCCPQEPHCIFSTVDEWAAHIQSTGHFFPAAVPEGDQFLIPRVVADPLISYVLEGLEFCEALPEEDFPMVDTLMQAVTKKQQEYAARLPHESD